MLLRTDTSNYEDPRFQSEADPDNPPPTTAIQTERGSDVSSSPYEDGRYKASNPSWHSEDSAWKANHILEILRSNSVFPGSVCEVGCGVGDILLNLSRAYPDIPLSGFDIAPEAHRMARLKETDSVRFFLADLLEEQIEPFDVLLAIDVVEHVDNYVDFVRRARAYARYKVFHFPLDLSVQSILRVSPIMNLRRDVGHIHYFFKETAEALLTDCGYKIIESRYTASRLELPNQARSSQLMAFPRRLLYAVHPDLAVRVLGGYSLLVLAE